jgi:regulator of PEP synthase PpsR (kinase-PPPase family)
VDGIIVHTLVDIPLRSELIALAHRRHVVEIDLMGPLLDQLTQRLGKRPLGQPGLYRRQNEEDLKRIEAIEFAVEHDDGKRVHELALAELVLVGVSRVGKTPLSMYLATLGWKVANIPLIKDIRPPEMLFQIDRRRVVGLTMEPGQLVVYRRQRERRMGTPPLPSYAEAHALHALAEELDYAHNVFRKGLFRIVDTTDKPIEEAAQEVLNITRQQG